VAPHARPHPPERTRGRPYLPVRYRVAPPRSARGALCLLGGAGRGRESRFNFSFMPSAASLTFRHARRRTQKENTIVSLGAGDIGSNYRRGVWPSRRRADRRHPLPASFVSFLGPVPP
jgi:hypothetical protein